MTRELFNPEYKLTYLEWLEEILRVHPIIDYYPVEQWEQVTMFNGWLPMPIYH